MEVGDYTKMSIILLALAIVAILLVLTNSYISFLGLFALFFIVPMGAIVSLVSVIKERTKLSFIVLSLFILIPIVFYAVIDFL